MHGFCQATCPGAGGGVVSVVMTAPVQMGGSSSTYPFPSPPSCPEPQLPGAADGAAAAAPTGQTESVVAQFVPSLPFQADELLEPQQADLSEAV